MLSSRNLIIFVLAVLALAIILGAPRLAPLFAPPVLTPTPQSAARIAFLSPADGEAKLYILDTVTNEVQALTEKANVSAFAVSDDGQIIYYAAANVEGGRDLWQLNLETGAANLLLSCQTDACDQPAISAVGTHLAYERRSATNEQLSSIWLLSLAEGESEQLSPAGDSSYDPQWSSAGELSYYNQTETAYIVFNPATGEERRHKNQSGAGVSWAANGAAFAAAEQRVVVTDIERLPSGEAAFHTPEPGSLDRVEVLVSQLYSYNANRRQVLIEIGDELIEDSGPSYSPDGAWLAFTRKYLDAERWTPGRQLWLLDLDYGEIAMLSDQPDHRVSGLAWSSDGRQLAFIRTNQITFGQPPELWILDIQTGNSQLVTVDAFSPSWLP